MEYITFKELNLSDDINKVLSKKGFKNPTQIQEKVIPKIIEEKNDIVAIAKTGTGKTGAFAIPIIDKITKKGKLPKAIVVTPTRELAKQVSKEFEDFSKEKKYDIVTVYGGAPINNQIKQLHKGCDIVVGTPGRIVDMINRDCLRLDKIEYFVLDEADEMLNMGFIEDIEYILNSSNENKRTFLFSATMPGRIKSLSKNYMNNQIVIEDKSKNNQNNELIEQSFVRVKNNQKDDTIINIINSNDYFYGIIFCKTKSDVDSLTKILRKNKFRVEAIHGDIAQSKREKTLTNFRKSKTNILVATDVASRGIDVDNISHVINHSLPQIDEIYVHRVGRTGRAGNRGKAISLVTTNEMRKMSSIEKMIGSQIKKENIDTSKEKSSVEINEDINKITRRKIDSKYRDLTKELIDKYGSEKLVASLLQDRY